ncbi:MAG TPA: hypothetical protein VIG69_01570 [Candidatus Methylomirabilis sp.]|jgi:hypothetical protein
MDLAVVHDPAAQRHGDAEAARRLHGRDPRDVIEEGVLYVVHGGILTGIA